MNNIEKSELVIAKVLGLLMEWGLSDASLEFEALGLDSEFMPFFATCVKWLEAEGLIRTDSIQECKDGSAYIARPILTAYGFARMGMSISVGSTTTTVGEVVQRTAKDTSYYGSLGELTGGFVGSLFKSLGS
jgi:hypothetical protein